VPNDNDTWQWQEPGEAWKGAGLYHITLTVPSREPLLGTLVIPDNNPKQAKLEALPLGRLLVNALWNLSQQHPQIQVLHYCLMPDHLHAVWYVRHKMPRGIKSAVQGFWQGAKQLGRAYSFLSSKDSLYSSDCQSEKTLDSLYSSDCQSEKPSDSSVDPTASRVTRKSLESSVHTLRAQLGDAAYYRLFPVFTELPHIRPMAQYRQLPATIRYIDMNPQRLATKRLMPGFFRVQEDIEIAGRRYSGVGNIALLQAERFAPVHVRRTMIDYADHGEMQPLRDYMNGCVLAARQGAVMVSPFISPKEKDVLDVLLKEQHPFILLSDNGFRDYYKPSDALFDAVAAGRALILSPWDYDPDKRHISRADCVALNAMAEDICGLKS